MSRLDIANHLSAVQSLKPAARTATANGTGVDLRNYNGAVAVIYVGTWTDGTHTFELQDSNDNSTFAAVPAADLIGTEPVVDAATEDEQDYEVGYIGSKRFLRVIATVSGATIGAVHGASIVRGIPRKLPD